MPLINRHHDCLDVRCPTCGAGVGESCRTLTTNRITDIHKARWDARFPPREQQAKVKP